MRTAWIIGASQGIGLAVAHRLQREGWVVIISARNLQQLESLKSRYGFGIYAFDASDEDQVANAVSKVFTNVECSPELVLINVGDYEPMSIDYMPVNLFIRLNQINYLAPMYLLAHLLPVMRDTANASVWVNVSLAAYRGLPKSAAYSAPKAAILNMVEALHVEAKTWGVWLGAINHGFVRTRLTEKNSFTMPGIIEVDAAAKHIVNGMKRKQFEITFPFAFSLWMKALRIIPYGLYFALTKRAV